MRRSGRAARRACSAHSTSCRPNRPKRSGAAHSSRSARCSAVRPARPAGMPARLRRLAGQARRRGGADPGASAVPADLSAGSRVPASGGHPAAPHPARRERGPAGGGSPRPAVGRLGRGRGGPVGLVRAALRDQARRLCDLDDEGRPRLVDVELARHRLEVAHGETAAARRARRLHAPSGRAAAPRVVRRRRRRLRRSARRARPLRGDVASPGTSSTASVVVQPPRQGQTRPLRGARRSRPRGRPAGVD